MLMKLTTGMSNSNHFAGCTLNFKTRKTYSGPQFRITKHSESILDIFIQFYLQMDQDQSYFLITYNFKLKSGLNGLQH